MPSLRRLPQFRPRLNSLVIADISSARESTFWHLHYLQAIAAHRDHFERISASTDNRIALMIANFHELLGSELSGQEVEARESSWSVSEIKG